MNVTPLVDVVLVLLIIFMVVIPALAESVELEEPGILNPDESSPADADPHILSVTSDGAMFLGEDPLAAEALEGRLMSASRREPGRRLVIRADGAVRYARVREIYATAQRVRFPGVSLRVRQLQPEGGE